ncbi:MAG: hypothetical protein ACREFX_11455 [Opitutaceae bacterium]
MLPVLPSRRLRDAGLLPAARVHFGRFQFDAIRIRADFAGAWS